MSSLVGANGAERKSEAEAMSRTARDRRWLGHAARTTIQAGQGLAEYILILALMALIAAVAGVFVGAHFEVRLIGVVQAVFVTFWLALALAAMDDTVKSEAAQLWRMAEPVGLYVTGLATCVVGIVFIEYGQSPTIPNQLTLVVMTAGGALVLAGLLAMLRIREDLVRLVLGGTTASFFAFALITIKDTDPATYGNLVAPLLAGGCLLGFVVFRGAYRPRAEYTAERAASATPSAAGPAAGAAVTPEGSGLEGGGPSNR